MKKNAKTMALAILVIMAAFLLTACGGSEPPKQQASIEDISIKTSPKTAYTVGDDFDIAGGVLLLSYDDGSTKELSFTAEGVKISSPACTAFKVWTTEKHG